MSCDLFLRLACVIDGARMGFVVLVFFSYDISCERVVFTIYFVVRSNPSPHNYFFSPSQQQTHLIFRKTIHVKPSG